MQKKFSKVFYYYYFIDTYISWGYIVFLIHEENMTWAGSPGHLGMSLALQAESKFAQGTYVCLQISSFHLNKHGNTLQIAKKMLMWPKCFFRNKLSHPCVSSAINVTPPGKEPPAAHRRYCGQPQLPSLGLGLVGSVTQTTVALVTVSSHAKDF